MLKSKLLRIYYDEIQRLRLLDVKTPKDYTELTTSLDTFLIIYDQNYDGVITTVHDNGESDIYPKLLEEFSIMAYYLNKKLEGLTSIDRLLMSGLNHINRFQAIGNIPYYIEIIPPDAIKLRKQIHFGVIDPNFTHMNYSIITKDNQYIALARYTNYSIDLNNGSYHIRGPGIHSRLGLAKISDDFQVISIKEVKDVSGLVTYPNSSIKGMEDPIIFKRYSELWFTCVSLESNAEQVLPQINICKMNEDYDVTLRIPVLSPSKGQEKNWLPIEDDSYDKLKFYRCGYGSDFTIQEIDIPPISMTVTSTSVPTSYKMNFSRFKGSAGPLKFNDGYLYLFHESIVKPQRNPSYYYNRFAYTNGNHEILMLSLPWKFDSCAIEFCRSICYNLKNPDEIIFTVSIGDTSSWIYILDVAYIRSLLRDLTYFQL